MLESKLQLLIMPLRYKCCIFGLVACKMLLDIYYLWRNSESPILLLSLDLGTDLEEVCITLAIASAVEVNSGLS